MPSSLSDWAAAVAIIVAILTPLFGLLVQNVRLSDAIKRIEHEVNPNSGFSFRDAVDRMEISNRGLHDGLSDVKEAVRVSHAWQDDHLKFHVQGKEDS